MLQPPRRDRSRLSRSLFATTAVAIGVALAPVTAAHAAALEESLSWSTFSTDFAWDGSQPMPPTGFSTGSWSAYVDQYVVAPGQAPACGPLDSYGSAPSCTPQHLRGGALLPDAGAISAANAISILPGDVIQAVNSAGGVVDSAAVTAPQPVISSVLGQPNFTIAKTATANQFEATLFRRVPRMLEHDTGVTPGTYSWYQGLPSDPGDAVETCHWFNYATQTWTAVTDVPPPKPTAAPDSGYKWTLENDRDCQVTTIKVQANPYEEISAAQLLAVTPTAYTATFGSNLQAGDVIEYSETNGSNVNDVDHSVTISNYATAGVVPPPDTTPPTATSFDFGASSTTIKSFTKHGFLVFVSMNEPGTVTEQLMLTPKPKKSKGKHHKKAVAPVPVLIGTGTGTVAAAGQTAKVNIVVTPAGHKLLKSLGGKPAHATLVTTLKDTAGNPTTTSTPYTLASK